MSEHLLSTHQKDLLRALGPGLLQGYTGMQWEVVWQDGKIDHIDGLGEHNFLWDYWWKFATRSDMDSFVKFGFLEVKAVNEAKSSTTYSLNRQLILKALIDDFKSAK